MAEDLSAKREVAVLVRHSPLNTVRAAEALRMSVGLTLGENQVTAYLLDAAAWLAVPLQPRIVGGGDVRKHLDTLLLLKMAVKVEAESLARYGVPEDAVLKGVQVVDQSTIVAELTVADVVIPF